MTYIVILSLLGVLTGLISIAASKSILDDIKEQKNYRDSLKSEYDMDPENFLQVYGYPEDVYDPELKKWHLVKQIFWALPIINLIAFFGGMLMLLRDNIVSWAKSPVVKW